MVDRTYCSASVEMRARMACACKSLLGTRRSTLPYEYVRATFDDRSCTVLSTVTITGVSSGQREFSMLRVLRAVPHATMLTTLKLQRYCSIKLSTSCRAALPMSEKGSG